MKKYLALILVGLLPFIGISQSIFDKYQDSENVGTVIINKGLLGIVASMSADEQDKETLEFIELAKSIDDIKIFVSEDASASADMAATMKKYVKSASLDEMMRVKDGDTNVRFYIKNGRNSNHVSELLMFVTGIDDKGKKENRPNFETVLLTMTGDIDLNKIGTITNKMNLPKQLKKAKGGK
ncbi:DUF4252 domain-containing protein [Croceitalea rosinachiae]|uniref:DUF4252 domain-containing protein n=1 Tax=Croceitalea rosinachiae TaxID=3075596 RepID=A0ABU3AAJ8_9FLAO|nr:DUF4252 domain-containing protein [Croceitalea sp. F388]MDT0607207.1 DUF4252 domain-containing protein [Croceitalea sp. F388]